MKEPFSIAWSRPVAFGWLVAVELPEGKAPVEAVVLGRLAPEEREAALREKGRRQIEWVGGRIAAREAARAMGAELGPVLAGPRREPMAPAGWAVSVSHKHALVVALVARADGASAGVDLEGDERDHLSIADRVLRPEEKAEVAAAPAAQRWNEVMVRFATKEAVYKALAPRLARYIGFEEARVEVDGLRSTQVTMFLKPGEPVPAIASALEWLDDRRVIAMVRASWIDG